MGKIAPTLEIRVPTKFDEAWLRDLLLTLKRQHEEIAKVINYQHGVDVAFSAHNEATQGPFSAETTINFATENFDLQEDYDGTNKFTAPADGIYHIGAQALFTGMTVGDELGLRMKKNASIILSSDLWKVPTTTDQKIFKVHGLFNLDAGDAITVTGARTTGTGTASVFGSTTPFSFFYAQAEIVIPFSV